MLEDPKIVASSLPRKNLPGSVGRKRGEDMFTLGFARRYLNGLLHTSGRQVFASGREVQVPSFGIADFCAVLQTRKSRRRDGFEIHAFEMKLSDWQKGFAQAMRYTYFADKVSLVVPPAIGLRALQQKQLFVDAGLGLIAFDKRQGTIIQLVRPTFSNRRATLARTFVVASLTPKIASVTLQTSKLSKLFQTQSKR